MPRKGRDTSPDRLRNELEEEEETVQTLQYSQDQVDHCGTAARHRHRKLSGAISDMLAPLQLDHY